MPSLFTPSLRRIAVFLTCSSLCFAPAHAAKPAAPPTAQPALTVTVAAPQRAEWPQNLAATGNIAAWQEAIIGAESNGLRLTELLVQVGDVVRRGQVLARFAEETVRAELAQQQAAVAEAEANASEAQDNAERVRKLDNAAALSPQQIAQIYAQEKSAAARLEAARARLAAETLRLKQATVVAPDDGVITSRNATVGAVAAAGQELFRLVRQSRLEWQAEVTANESAAIKAGQKVSVIAPNGKNLAGVVRKIAPTVDVRTRKLLVYVDVQGNDAALADVKPGMFVSGEIKIGASNALIVPGSAVVLRDGFAHVFVLGAQNKVKQTKVNTGRQRDGKVEVEGIAADANIVVTGAGLLADGDLVKVVAK